MAAARRRRGAGQDADHVSRRWRPADRGARDRLPAGLERRAPGARRQRRRRAAPARRLRRSARQRSALRERAGHRPTPSGAPRPANADRRMWSSIWQEPDQGMWESRGGAAALRLFQGDGLGRGRPLPAPRRPRTGFAPEAARRNWRRCARDSCRRLREGLRSRARTASCSITASRHLDASVLLLPLVGFLPADDARIAGTIAAIEDELMEEGFVRRQEAPWLGKEEGVFLPCSCWLADCLAMQGRHDEARALFERVLAVANDLGAAVRGISRALAPADGQFPAGADAYRRGEHRPEPMRPDAAARRRLAGRTARTTGLIDLPGALRTPPMERDNAVAEAAAEAARWNKRFVWGRDGENAVCRNMCGSARSVARA